LTPLFVASPFLGQIQSEVEQSVVLWRDITHKYTDLAVINFASVTTPLPFDPNGMSAALGEAARIEGDNASGVAQMLRHLTH
jgi:hypothetical protein